MSSTAPSVSGSAPHTWTFHRVGGLDQVVLASGADLLALDQLDQKLWVALSCPVRGLELDEKTLALIDTDHDGRIRVPEVLAAIKWAAVHLKDVGDLLRQTDRIPLAAINDATADGRRTLASARAILRGLGREDATEVTLADASDTVRLFSGTPFNGDGVVTAAATDDPALQALMADIVKTVGGEPDRSGETGINAAKVDAFFQACADFDAWMRRGEAGSTLGAHTAAAAAAVRTLRKKADDFFGRTRLADFDPRALSALNRSESDYIALAAQDLTITSEEIAGFPLAQVEPGKPLPLTGRVNPAWRGALEALREHAVAPLFGPDKVTLTEEEWQQVKARLAPHEAWLGEKAGAVVEPLGMERVRRVLGEDRRAALHALIAQDAALEPEFNSIHGVERLARYTRDFRTLLNNFVNFADFYSQQRLATFQAGRLFIDSRSTQLCVYVANPTEHAKLASLSQAYIAYCDLKREGAAPMKLAACITQGDSDYLRVGRNGLFYDRQGRDWDATIVHIVDNPISVRQAFWLPYKKVARFVEEQMAKFAAAKEKAGDEGLAAGLARTTTPAAAGPGAGVATPRPAFDIAKFAGIFAAIGLALGAIGGALASIAVGFMRLAWWQMPLAIFGAMLVVSGPSMLLAALKLRQRTLGPILDANGWAINGRVRINIPFGTMLTRRAVLPDGSRRRVADPYGDGRGRRWWGYGLLVGLLVVAAGAAWWLGTWPFER